MNYESVEVRTYLRYALCGCGGRLIVVPDASMRTSSPPWWLHRCQACAAEQFLQEKSPALVTQEAP